MTCGFKPGKQRLVSRLIGWPAMPHAALQPVLRLAPGLSLPPLLDVPPRSAVLRAILGEGEAARHRRRRW
jgi:hypothetical protein